MASIPAELASALAERYALERELGRGGMATVYLARDLRHKRPVALKVLRPELAQALGAERFQREIELAARLQHPHILTVFDSGEADGNLWFTMPYVEGESLRDRLTRERQLPIAEAARIAGETARALDYAHRHGVVHRDIKPENILLTRDGDTLVADFGIARALDATDARLTDTGLAIGTPAYMSPEQASGDKSVDARSDIYSAGAVLYEMLAGEPPFTGPTAQAILARRFTESPRPLRTARETVPEPLERAVLTALARTPADRFATAGEFAAAIASAASGATPPAIPAIPAIPATTTTTTILTTSAAAGGPLGVRSGRFRAVAVALCALAAAAAATRFYRSRATPAAAAPKMLVVLPLKNLGAPADQYFADGLTEEITSRLASLSGLGVISRTTADGYRNTTKSVKEIGRELGAGYVLEGSVRWERDSAGRGRVRVTPQLIEVADDRHLWADRYDADLKDVFEVQGRIGEQVAGALDVALRPAERRALAARPTANPDAYDAYLRGNDADDRTTAEDERRAIGFYRRAVALDSNFAAAWARLGQAEGLTWWFAWDRSRAALARADTAVRRALALDPSLPAAHEAMGWYALYSARDYDRALAEFAIAERARPNDGAMVAASAYVRRRQGRWDDAIATLRRAARLDPRSVDVAQGLAETYLLAHRYAEADSACARTIALAPDVGFTYWMRMLAAAGAAGGAGGAAAARAVFHAALARMPFAGLMAQSRMPAPVALLAGDSTFRADVLALTLADYGPDSVGYYRVKADSYQLTGEPARAGAYYDSLAAVARHRLRTAGDYAFLHTALAAAETGLGHRAEALAEARRAEQLEPIGRDHFFGAMVLGQTAPIYLAAGLPDSALARLRVVVAEPSFVSAGGIAGDPAWEALRGRM